MKREKISDAVGNINEKYLEEAADYMPSVSTPRIKWISLAACFCLIFVGGLVGLVGNQDEPNATKGNPYDETYNDANANYTVFSVGNGILKLEIYDCYTIPNEADVISVRISSKKNSSTVYFRSSDKIEGQAIKHIESLSATQSVTHKDGIYAVELAGDQEFAFLNICFDEGVFKKSAQANDLVKLYSCNMLVFEKENQ